MHIILYGNINFPYEFIYDIFNIKNCIFDPKNIFSELVLQNESWSTQKVAFYKYPQKIEKKQGGDITGGSKSKKTGYCPPVTSPL